MPKEETIKKCPRCQDTCAVLQSTGLDSLERWLNLKELRLMCIGIDKRKPPRRLDPWEEGIVTEDQRYPDCHQTYKLKIKVLGIEPE